MPRTKNDKSIKLEEFIVTTVQNVIVAFFLYTSIDKSIEITGLRAHNLNFSSLPRQHEHGEVGECLHTLNAK